MATACGTKWSPSSVLNTYGKPWRSPHSRRAAPPAITSASPGHAQRRGRSAVAIDGVVATGEDAPESALWDLVPRIVTDVDDRHVEDRAAERIDGHTAARQPALERVRVLGHIGACLAAGDDVTLIDAVEDPARVRDQLVVGQRQQRAAVQLGPHLGVGERDGKPLVEVLVIRQRGAQAREADRRGG